VSDADKVYPEEVEVAEGSLIEKVDVLVARLLAAPSWMRRVEPGSWEEAAVAVAKQRVLEQSPDLLGRATTAGAAIDLADVERRRRHRQSEVDYGEAVTAATADLPPAADLFVRLP